MLGQSVDRLHKKAIVVDTHGDILHNQIKSGLDIGALQLSGQFDLVRAKQGGLDVHVFAVWSDETGGLAIANEQIDSLYALINRYPQEIALVRDVKSLKKAVANNQLAALIGVEGGHMIEDNLENIDALAARGMVYLTLTWNNSTSWASSAAHESGKKITPDQAGINDFGKQVIERLNKLGVMVDLSHVGEKTFFDAINLSRKPVIVSHSSVHAINPVPRNLTDAQIRAVGKNGGVVFVNFYSGFLDAGYNDRQKAFLAKHEDEIKSLSVALDRSVAIDSVQKIYRGEWNNIGPSIDVLVNHIDHIVKLIGVDHVGLGADYDGAESFPKGLESVADYPKVTEALLKRGYSEKDIKKILGGNFIRLLKANKGS